jgi:hypothetical protein
MNVFETTRAVRGLPRRHPDAPPSVVLVAYAMASYADGATGTNIRPGVARLASDTGLHPRTVEYSISWLVERGEVRRDKAGHRGNAASFSWVGGMGKGEESPQAIQPPAKPKPAGSVQKACGNDSPHLPDLPSPSAIASSSPSTHVTEEAKTDGRLAHVNRAARVCTSCSAPATTTHDQWPSCEPCREEAMANARLTEQRSLYEAVRGRA